MRTFSVSGISGFVMLAALFRFWSKWCQVILMAVGETCWIVRFNLEKGQNKVKKIFCQPSSLPRLKVTGMWSWKRERDGWKNPIMFSSFEGMFDLGPRLGYSIMEWNTAARLTGSTRPSAWTWWSRRWKDRDSTDRNGVNGGVFLAI